MNKRQIKKRYKIINERLEFFGKRFIMSGRQNGKTSFIKNIHRACFSKKYKYFKALKKVYDGYFTGIDLGSGRDYTVQNIVRIKNGIITIVSSKVL